MCGKVTAKMASYVLAQAMKHGRIILLSAVAILSAAKEADAFCRKDSGYRAWVIRWAAPSDSTMRFQCLNHPTP
jgi:hypothetical protein